MFHFFQPNAKKEISLIFYILTLIKKIKNIKYIVVKANEHHYN